jgi:hypothetical protein
MTAKLDQWMDRLTRSKHAQERCRARSISDRVLELVFLYGRQHRRHGADVYLLDRRGFEELRASEDPEEVRALLPKLRAYFVISDDWTLVTAGYVIDEASPVAAAAALPKRQGPPKREPRQT